MTYQSMPGYLFLTPEQIQENMKNLWKNKHYREKMFASKNHIIKPKLTDEQVKEIKQSPLPITKLANNYNVRYGVIRGIKKKIYYKWVDVPIIESERKKRKSIEFKSATMADSISDEINQKIIIPIKRKKKIIIPSITDPYILLMQFKEWDSLPSGRKKRNSNLKLKLRQIRVITNEFNIKTAGMKMFLMEKRLRDYLHAQ